MGISCLFGRHRVLSRGVRNGNLEFARCENCHRDLVRGDHRWKTVPRGYRVVWRPRTGDPVADRQAGSGVIRREVTIKGVVVGEKMFGAQRFALVRLNAEDGRSYLGGFDQLDAGGSERRRRNGAGERPIQESLPTRTKTRVEVSEPA